MEQIFTVSFLIQVGLLFSILFVSILALLCSSYRLKVGTKYIVAFFVTIILYSLFYYMELLTNNSSLAEAFFILQVISISFMPSLWLMFILTYTNNAKYLKASLILAIFLIPIIGLFLIVTIDSHELFYYNLTLVSINGLSTIEFYRGPWAWIHSGYLGFSVLLGCYMLLKEYSNSLREHRINYLILAIGSLIPLFTLIINLLSLNPFGFDSSPFGLTIGSLFFAYGFTRHDILNPLPLARTQVFDEIDDAVLILDTKEHIIDMNTSATKLIYENNKKVNEQIYNHLYEALSSQNGKIDDMFKIDLANQEKWIEIKRSSISNNDGTLLGYLIILHDTTNKVKALQAEKNDLLLKEIHHRVKNNLQVISSLINLEKKNIKDEQLLTILTRTQTRIRSMSIAHEKLYQGESAASINIPDYTKQLSDYLSQLYCHDKKVLVKHDIDDINLEVDLATPLGLLINEIVTNSLKHAFSGKIDGKIKVEFKDIGDEYRLKVCDNGVGIPQDIIKGYKPSLGLQLIEMLTKQLQGKLTIESNHGTKMEILFPKN
ncbi:histidine kinase N-terminal 7TM domain-containing protein [Methanosalsum natronophilum]|uniref:histidine kinase N-terminal 7TM domain-containing protein n=1 Tax=Methanosalsum natronophilum TaxID=768733 RepID=UPI00216A106E|nr:histidine kinase N-terminal 7TM domain-containing protein [Methanosalsum natronophilum]MCS3923262.1 two-component sensor histidine kinase [Methanosalsum natronophilum]